MFTPLTVAGIAVAALGIGGMIALGRLLHELEQLDIFRAGDDL